MKKTLSQSFKKYQENLNNLLTINLAWSIAIFTSFFLAFYFFGGAIPLFIFVLLMLNVGLYMIIFKLYNLKVIDFSSFYVGIKHPLISTSFQLKLCLKSFLFGVLAFFGAAFIGGVVLTTIVSVNNPEMIQIINEKSNAGINELMDYFTGIDWINNAQLIIGYVSVLVAILVTLFLKAKNGFALLITFEYPILPVESIKLSRVIVSKRKKEYNRLNILFLSLSTILLAATVGLYFAFSLSLNSEISFYLASFIFILLIAPIYTFYITNKIVIYNQERAELLEEFKKIAKNHITEISDEDFKRKIKEWIDKGVINEEDANNLTLLNDRINEEVRGLDKGGLEDKSKNEIIEKDNTEEPENSDENKKEN